MTLPNTSHPTNIIEHYKTYKNCLTSIIRKSKSLYYQNKLILHSKNIKKTWNTINEILRRKNTTSAIPSFILHDNRQIHGNRNVANCFNHTFTNIGRNLASLIDNAHQPYAHYLGPRSPNSFFLRPTHDLEVLKIVSRLSNSASGVDNIPPKLLKSIIHFIINPLVHIIKLSFISGVVPNCLKLAKVTPIFKPGSSCTRTVLNYRPIRSSIYLKNL